jgi:hypothetical protein
MRVIGQFATWHDVRLDTMLGDIQIIEVKIDHGDGLIVTFSDGTIGAYVAEELLELRPCRELNEKPVDSS